MMLLFKFEKKYYDKNDITSTFVGHPLLDVKGKDKIDLGNLLDKNKKIISIFPGSRLSEIKTFMPILINFIKLSNKKYKSFDYIFHSTLKLNDKVKKILDSSDLKNYKIVSDESIKNHILSNSIFAIAKSGTISLEISNAQIPSIIIYKMNFLNFFIIKRLVKIKYANIFNIISNFEIIPELLQSKCNYKTIFELFDKFIKNPELCKEQILSCNKILKDIKTETSSAEKAASVLNSYLR